MRGTVYRRGARWWAAVDLPRDETGRRRRAYRGGFATREEAERALALLLGEVAAGGYVEPADLTVAELAERWLRDYVEPRLRPKTQDSYRRLLSKHILPALGAARLRRLQAHQIQSLYARMVRDGLSPRTVRYAHAILHRMLACAVKWGLLGRNVADQVSPPAERRREPAVLDEEGARRLLSAARGDRLHALWALALGTGMRRGELLGLKWEDVDLEAGIITVRRSLVEVSGQRIFQEPKTASGRRRVELTPALVEILRRHRAAQARERLALGPAYQDNGLVFCQEDGRPLHPHNVVRRSFRRLLARAGLPPIRFHDLRHSHATLLLTRGTHPKVVQERLGHSRIGTTLDTYSHIVPGMQRDAALRLDHLFRQDDAGAGKP